jgi:hypothetical protein
MAGTDKPGGISFGCPSPMPGGHITMSELCDLLGEISKWIENIRTICDALPKEIKEKKFELPTLHEKGS